VWRKERATGISPKQRAMDMLKKGFTPAQILQYDLDAYFTHYKAIESVYRVICESEISLIAYGEEE
jgi:hypothetical protein